MLTDVEAIVFDLDNTLIDTIGADKCAFDKVHQYLHSNYPIFQNPKQVIDSFKMLLCSGVELNMDSLNANRSVKKSSSDVRFEMWCEAVERNIPADSNAKTSIDPSKIAAHCNSLWSKTRQAGFLVTPPVAKLLEKLKQANFKLGILTNGPPDVQNVKIGAIIDTLPADVFDCVVITGQYGIHKPDPRIFEITCQQLGTKPNKTVMVGDSLDHDILGGNFAGWKTVWYNPDGNECDSISKKATCEIKCLNDLALVINIQ